MAPLSRDRVMAECCGSTPAELPFGRHVFQGDALPAVRKPRTRRASGSAASAGTRWPRSVHPAVPRIHRASGSAGTAGRPSPAKRLSPRRRAIQMRSPRRPRPSVGWFRSCSPTSSASRPLSESRDPEEVRELLTRYFEESRRVVERYGGVVEKFIGDAVMARVGFSGRARGRRRACRPRRTRAHRLGQGHGRRRRRARPARAGRASSPARPP